MNSAEPAVIRDQFRLMVSSVTEYAIFMLDPAGVIVTWNDGAQRIKGYRADEIIGRHFSVFYPEQDARNRKPDWELEVARREGRYEEEGWRIRKDGTKFWASVVITALRDDTGRLRGFGKVTRDLTERKRTEERREAAREAEAAGLRRHAERMAELEQTKTQFLNLASHELRGPLTVIRGYNSMLQDGTIPTEQIGAVARIVETKLVQMDLLIDQMLETARLEQSDLAYAREPFDLGAVAQEQIDVFRAVGLDKTFLVQPYAGPLVVVGDRARIGTIVANLLDNASKYSPGGEEIVCSFGRDGAGAFVSVCDHGPGIEAEHLPMLFKRFGRLPTEKNSTVPGTGLGLFLCREIAQRHGGDITVRSTPGAGSDFTLRLPLQQR